jgi:hypothetical protein
MFSCKVRIVVDIQIRNNCARYTRNVNLPYSVQSKSDNVVPTIKYTHRQDIRIELSLS